MTRWKTSTIEQILDLVAMKLATGDPGSEMTTPQLIYEAPGAKDKIYVRGFVTDHNNPISNPDDTDIEMIEVTSEYSDGGDSRETSNIVTRALIHAALVAAGHDVVRSMDAYF